MADTLIKTLENGEYAELKSNIEQVIAKKVAKKINAKKDDITKKLNGFKPDNTGE